MPPPCLGEIHGRKYKNQFVLEGQELILEGYGLLGCLLGCLGGSLWLSWYLVGVLEASWRHFGAILGASWALGLILGLLGLMLGSCWASWGHVGATLVHHGGHYGAILGYPGVIIWYLT